LGGRLTVQLDAKSNLAKRVYYLLLQAFPHIAIYQEYYCRFKGQPLYFDFYIREYSLLFEVQGQQHYQYTEHFHQDKQGFLDSKRRDNLKKEYCESRGYTLIEIRFDEKLETPEDLIKKIKEAQNRQNDV
jgi:very-short-patch-repair endonuclease